jgi:hypothetical protein
MLCLLFLDSGGGFGHAWNWNKRLGSGIRLVVLHSLCETAGTIPFRTLFLFFFKEN